MLQPGEAIRVGGEFFGQDLDRNVPLQCCIPCPKHLAHATRTERLEDVVMTQRLADHRAVASGGPRAHLPEQVFPRPGVCLQNR